MEPVNGLSCGNMLISTQMGLYNIFHPLCGAIAVSPIRCEDLCKGPIVECWS